MSRRPFKQNPNNGEKDGLWIFNQSRNVWDIDVLPGDTNSEDLLLPGQKIGWEIEYLVIGGGGGGSADRSGGGGAGGYRSSVHDELSGKNTQAEETSIVNYGSYQVTVGAGGAGGTLAENASGTKGGTSSFYNIISLGGGAGGFDTGDSNANGGSGGGAGIRGSGEYRAGGSGTAGQGFDGGEDGTGADQSLKYMAGGGGGAGEAGGNGVDSFLGGKGGDGISSSITGVATYRAGGGGGGQGSSNSSAGYSRQDGGLGGGGTSNRGYSSSPIAASFGVTNTGGGGGGGGRGHTDSGSSSNMNGANGGSGVVIIKYISSLTISIGSGLVHSTNVIGNYKITIFTAGSDTITFS